jgi:alkylated DNA repair dioxygenase AlkB
MQPSFTFLSPTGFEYIPDFLSTGEETSLIETISSFPLSEFKFHGYVGHRRVASFGWSYDFANAQLKAAQPIPNSLLWIREKVAPIAGIAPESYEQILVSEYRPGTVIGWHRDKAVFGEVAGISLSSPCTFRFRHKAGDKWERFSQQLQPRSAYLLRGEIRDTWEHSIPPVPGLRYSITFRTLR